MTTLFQRASADASTAASLRRVCVEKAGRLLSDGWLARWPIAGRAVHSEMRMALKISRPFSSEAAA